MQGANASIFKFCVAIKKTKVTFKAWNKNTLGKVQANIKNIITKIEAIQSGPQTEIV